MAENGQQPRMLFATSNGLRSLVVEREERRLHLGELGAVQDAVA